MKLTYVCAMHVQRTALAAGVLALGALGGCRGVGQATTPGVTMVIGPSAAISPSPPQTRFVAGGLEVPAPAASGSAAPADLKGTRPAPPAASNAPAPLPLATPDRLTGGMFAVTVPNTWRRRVDGDAAVLLALEGPAAAGRFVARADDADGVSLAAWQTMLRDQAGDGLVAASLTSLDELGGVFVSSNRHTADGPRYFRAWGFMYRRQFVTLTASWDKLDPQAAAVQLDVDALIKSWKWL